MNSMNTSMNHRTALRSTTTAARGRAGRARFKGEYEYAYRRRSTTGAA